MTAMAGRAAAERSAAAIECSGLGKRYGRTWALRDCTLSLPEGRVVALIGPNGAGKTTFLSLVMGLAEPTEGTVLADGHPAGGPGALARVAFMGQDHPLYKRFTVADHLRMGCELNAGFDLPWARARLADLDIPLRRPAGRLSGGQQAQVALTLALAEPVASLDPIARREVMTVLMTRVAETGATVVFSSHVVAELERVCDYLVVMSRTQVQLAGATDDLIAAHARLIGPGRAATGAAGGDGDVPAGVAAVLERSASDAQTVLLARLSGPVADPRWEARPVTVEDIALGYMAAPGERYQPSPRLSVVSGSQS